LSVAQDLDVEAREVHMVSRTFAALEPDMHRFAGAVVPVHLAAERPLDHLRTLGRQILAQRRDQRDRASQPAPQHFRGQKVDRSRVSAQVRHALAANTFGRAPRP
jgi:hypothetical protein